MSELAPVPPRERLVTLDVLRGFALCGVMIGNMILYSGQWAEHGPALDRTTLDEIADWFLTIFVRSTSRETGRARAWERRAAGRVDGRPRDGHRRCR